MIWIKTFGNRKAHRKSGQSRQNQSTPPNITFQYSKAPHHSLTIQPYANGTMGRDEQIEEREVLDSIFPDEITGMLR